MEQSYTSTLPKGLRGLWNGETYLHTGPTCLEALELLLRKNIPYFGLSTHHDILRKYKRVAFCCPVFSSVRKTAKSGC